ncbi:toxin-antitoxin system, toxin component, Txe/YoeB family [Arcobacter acticola]|jgi:toxin YoeB|uniref:Putative mRNA interferase YoeB n=1 Tax=Arcobacter acticola TaxID=1849015 RepID=A0A6M8EYS3_9BACT|nr:Txe/YoeB family addiction module toxin [Arcobacter acticola]QKE28244.1 toxin-antitoxin system, toxin component, Txe/YoeB family [Arcobacter acticola]
MVEYKILYSKLAQKDAKKLSATNLQNKAKELIETIKKDPFQNPPPYEKLVGNLSGAYSRRINIQHRLVYEVREEDKVLRILRMWSQYRE